MCGDDWHGPMDPETLDAVLAMLERQMPPDWLYQCAPAIGVHRGCGHVVPVRRLVVERVA